MKKVVKNLLFLMVTVLFLTTGCSKAQNDNNNNQIEENQSEAEENGTEEQVVNRNQYDGYMVALITDGSIEEPGDSQKAYKGLLAIESLGAQVAYLEEAKPDAVSVGIEEMTKLGYKVFFFSSPAFQEGVVSVAADYPDVDFFLYNSTVSQDNVHGFGVKEEQQGFLLGAIAAKFTESGKVGFIGGIDVLSVKNVQKGFEKGVQHINGDIEVITAYSESMTDSDATAKKAQEVISSGADILTVLAEKSSKGAVEYAEAKRVYVICSDVSQEQFAPENSVVIVDANVGIAFQEVFKMFVEGTLPSEVVKLGVEEEVITLSGYLPGASVIEGTKKNDIDNLFYSMKSGGIELALE